MTNRPIISVFDQRQKHLTSYLFVFRSECGFKNVIACDYHCLAYTSDSIYVWGTNYGQFGFPATEIKVVQPKKVRISIETTRMTQL